MDSTKCLKAIMVKYKELIDDPETLYTCCRHKWIVMSKKLPDTVTNEEKLVDGVNDKYMRYRANKVKILKIINKYNCEETANNVFTKRSKPVVVGSTLDYGDNPISDGVLFNKSIRVAFYAGLNKVKNGKIIRWHENGTKKYEAKYKNGILLYELTDN